MLFSEEKINEVSQATDIVALIRQYVDLKRVGNSWKGLCPFHGEKTPSLIVHPEKGYFHCFGCGAGGGAIKFLMLINGQTFPDALRDLAQRAGIPLPQPKGSEPDSRPLKSAIYEVMKKANEFYRANLWSHEGGLAREYLLGRGLSQRVLEEYSLGLSLEGWDNLLKMMSKEGFSTKILEEAGLIRRRNNSPGHYDVFRNRIMIPIEDPEKRVVAFAARLYKSETDQNLPKYINTQATPIYTKGRLLYGFAQARSHIRSGGIAFIVEGYFDLISLVSSGVKPVVAAMGTALTQTQVNILKGQAKEIQLVFDSDAAGENAGKRALPLLFNAELDGRVIRLPDGHDPDTFIRKYGAEAFFQLADRAQDIAEYFIDRLMAQGQGTMTGQSHLITLAKEILSQVPDQAKGQYLRNKLADKLGLTREVLPISGKSQPKDPRFEGLTSPKPESYDPVAMRLLKHVIIHPESAAVLADNLEDKWPNDKTKPIFEAILNQLKNDKKINPNFLRFDDDDHMSSLISEAVLSKRAFDAQESVNIANHLRTKLLELAADRMQKEHTKAIRVAEAAGDNDLVKKLTLSKFS